MKIFQSMNKRLIKEANLKLIINFYPKKIQKMLICFIDIHLIRGKQKFEIGLTLLQKKFQYSVQETLSTLRFYSFMIQTLHDFFKCTSQIYLCPHFCLQLYNQGRRIEKSSACLFVCFHSNFLSFKNQEERKELHKCF